GNSFGLVEVADVVRSVARCVDDLDLSRAELEIFTALQDAQILRRNGKCFAEQALQFAGPEALGAGKKLGRVRHVRRAIPVDIHGKAGIFADERAGSAGVIQVDVGEEDGVEVAHADATGLELLVQGLERGARARVDHGAVAVRFQKARGNGTGPPHPEVVERGNRVHKRRSVAQDGKVD